MAGDVGEKRAIVSMAEPPYDMKGSGIPAMGMMPMVMPTFSKTWKTIMARTFSIRAARIAGRRPMKPFRYFNAGNLATIGRSSAVADFGWIRVSGFPAWLLWGIVHIFFLIGFRNRVSILIEWIWAYFTFQRGARLITGPEP